MLLKGSKGVIYIIRWLWRNEKYLGGGRWELVIRKQTKPL